MDLLPATTIHQEQAQHHKACIVEQGIQYGLLTFMSEQWIFFEMQLPSIAITSVPIASCKRANKSCAKSKEWCTGVCALARPRTSRSARAVRTPRIIARATNNECCGGDKGTAKCKDNTCIEVETCAIKGDKCKKDKDWDAMPKRQARARQEC
jgi:hypothetical protein